MALAMLPSIGAIGSIYGSELDPIWGTPQDTSQAQPMAPRGMRMAPHMGIHGMMMPGMMMHGMGMRGMGMHSMPGMMDFQHVGPGLLLGLRSELGLSDDQVSRLEKIRQDHHALMEGMHKNMQELRESMVKARSEGDWAALESSIDEMARLQAGMSKSHLNVERESLQVVNESQRQKLETWEEGARLFRHHWLQGRPHMQAPGMGAGSMHRHQRAGPPLPPPK
jgi:hypothetical protein